MKRGTILTVRPEIMTYGGKGLLKHKGEAIFVNGGLPGQLLEVEITKSKRRYSEAKIVKVLERADYEVDPGYQAVPGAPWTTVPYEKQLEWKVGHVKELMQKFGKVDIEPIMDEVLASPLLWDYRNKMEFSFGPTEETYETEYNEEKQREYKIWSHTGFGLGSKKRGQFWLVENLEQASGIFDTQWENAMPKIRAWCESTGFSVYNQKTHEGFWRHLVVRKSETTQKFLVNIVTSERGELDKESFVSLLKDLLGDRIMGIVHTLSDSLNDDTKKYTKRTWLFGHQVLREELAQLTFRVSLDSFFQTNTKSAERLYGKVIEYAEIEQGTTALDLFCGTGTIGQMMAKGYPNIEIEGVDIVESAVQDANENAERNSITNAKFVAADVRHWLKDNIERLKDIGTVVVDPPRAGIHPKALKRVIEIGAPKLVYVSCNPSTLARDTAELIQAGYSLQKVSVVDQFPHTYHIEVVTLFQKQ